MEIKDIPFVIIGPGRVGSSLLVKTLDAHPNIDCRQEYFWAKGKGYPELAKKYNTSDSIQLLRYIINDPADPWNLSTGFKFLFNNHHEKTTELYEALLKCNSIKKILLIRNPLERYISQRTGDKTNGTFWLGQNTSNIKIAFDKKDFLKFMEKSFNDYQYALKRISGPMITIDYKDVCSTICQKELCAFINVPYVHAKLPDWADSHDGTTKQNHTQMSYRVENFTEMVDYISTTPYKEYLV